MYHPHALCGAADNRLAPVQLHRNRYLFVASVGGHNGSREVPAAVRAERYVAHILTQQRHRQLNANHPRAAHQHILGVHADVRRGEIRQLGGVRQPLLAHAAVRAAAIGDHPSCAAPPSPLAAQHDRRRKYLVRRERSRQIRRRLGQQNAQIQNALALRLQAGVSPPGGKAFGGCNPALVYKLNHSNHIRSSSRAQAAPYGGRVISQRIIAYWGLGVKFGRRNGKL